MSSNELLPIGVWIRVPGVIAEPVTAFTYVDPQAGPSAMVFNGAEHVPMILRMNPPLPFERMAEDEILAAGVPSAPEQVEHYGPQPPAGTVWGEWRTHPHLAGRLLPDHPDDLQVMLHDGGPRFSPHQPEGVWVRVTGMEPGPAGLQVFRGTLLNQPFHLQSAKQYDTVKFVCPNPEVHAISVSDDYLATRADWVIKPCSSCGATELFDSPYDLMAAMSAGMDGEMMPGFTSQCPMCDGMFLVHWSGASRDESMGSVSVRWTEHLRHFRREPRRPVPGRTGLAGSPERKPKKEKWWQFWKS